LGDFFYSQRFKLGNIGPFGRGIGLLLHKKEELVFLNFGRLMGKGRKGLGAQGSFLDAGFRN